MSPISCPPAGIKVPSLGFRSPVTGADRRRTTCTPQRCFAGSHSGDQLGQSGNLQLAVSNFRHALRNKTRPIFANSAPVNGHHILIIVQGGHRPAPTVRDALAKLGHATTCLIRTSPLCDDRGESQTIAETERRTGSLSNKSPPQESAGRSIRAPIFRGVLEFPGVLGQRSTANKAASSNCGKEHDATGR